MDGLFGLIGGFEEQLSLVDLFECGLVVFEWFRYGIVIHVSSVHGKLISNMFYYII